MAKTLSRKSLATILSLIMLLSIITVPTQAEGTTAPQTLGTVVLSETFDGEIGTDLGSSYNGWGVINKENVMISSTTIPYTKDSFFTVAGGTEAAIWNNTSGARMPFERVAKLQRTASKVVGSGADTTYSSAEYAINKALAVSADAKMLEIGFRIMADDNAKVFQIRSVNGKNATSTMSIYLKAYDATRKVLISGDYLSSSVSSGTALASLKWYDFNFMFDYISNTFYAYIDGNLIGSVELTTTNFASPADFKKIEITTSRTGALIDGTKEGNFYLDDLKVTSYAESEKGAFVAEKLKGYIPGTIVSTYETAGKPTSSTLTLPTSLYGEEITYSENSDVLSIENGVCTVTHKENGDITNETITATIAGAPFDIPVRVAPQNVYVAENFEGNFAEKRSEGIAGLNNWTNTWKDTLATDLSYYETSEELVEEANGNHAGRYYKAAESSNSVDTGLVKKFGRTFNTSTAPKGISVKFSLKSGTDTAKYFEVILDGNNDETITVYMDQGRIKTGGTLRTVFVAPDMAFDNREYPTEGGVADKWYDFEIYTPLTANATVKLYVDGMKFADLAGAATAPTPYQLQIHPNRTAMGSGAEFLFDNIEVKAVTENELALQSAADGVALFEEMLYADVALPSAVGDGISVVWKSSDTSVITDAGKIATENADVAIMSATFSKNGDTLTRNYKVSVGAKDAAKIESLSKVTNEAVVNVNSARLSENAKLIVGAFEGEKLLYAKPYSVANELGTVKADLRWLYDDANYADAQIKAFLWDMGKLTPFVIPHESKADAKRIFMCGDSTMDSYGYDYKKASDPETARLSGWGEEFGKYFDMNKAVVENHALSGSNTKSFYEDNLLWQRMKPNFKEGDYVLIQFGHNDQDDLTIDEYKEYLEKMVEEAKEVKAIPVFITSINRMKYVNGKFTDTLGDYPKTMKDIATELDVPVIDMHAKTAQWLTQIGENEAMKYFRYSREGTDYTHLNTIGARKIASMVVEEIQNNTALAGLAAYLK